MLGDHIIGPFFIDGTLNGEKYLNLLQNSVIPKIQELYSLETNNIWFQQDGCPAHNIRTVREFLNTTFPNKWIGTNGPIRWPPRSPDLAPNDFFIWGFIKNSIFGHPNRPKNLDELRNQILENFNSITPQMLQNVRRSFVDRLGYCTAQKVAFLNI